MRRGTRHTRGPKRHRKVSWLTQENQLAGQLLQPNENQFFLLGSNADNDFVQNHPKFAKANDVIRLKRIVGQLRLAMYFNDNATFPSVQSDATIYYGICIIKGDYGNDGTWTPPDATLIPNAAEASDQDDKWLYQNRVILTPGATYWSSNTTVSDNAGNEGLDVNTVNGVQTPFYALVQPSRPTMLSTDEQLPMGSSIDLSTRRILQYAEKLAIIVNLEYGGNVDVVDFYVEPFLRVLIGG